MKSKNRHVLTLSIAFLLPAALTLYFTPPQNFTDYLVAAVVGAIFAAATFFTRALTPHLGAITTIAALALIALVAALLWTSLSPVCPGSPIPQRCTPPEVALWGLGAAMIAASYSAAILIPVRALTGTLNKIKNWRTKSKKQK